MGAFGAALIARERYEGQETTMLTKEQMEELQYSTSTVSYTHLISITEPLSDDPTSILMEALLEAMDEYYSCLLYTSGPAL